MTEVERSLLGEHIFLKETLSNDTIDGYHETNPDQHGRQKEKWSQPCPAIHGIGTLPARQHRQDRYFSKNPCPGVLHMTLRSYLIRFANEPIAPGTNPWAKGPESHHAQASSVTVRTGIQLPINEGIIQACQISPLMLARFHIHAGTNCHQPIICNAGSTPCQGNTIQQLTGSVDSVAASAPASRGIHHEWRETDGWPKQCTRTD